MKPEISVLLCTYNSEDFLDPCLKSILSQTFKEFEVICIDGGSQDNTLEKIKKYMSKDSRVKLIINKKRFPEGKGFGKSLGFQEAQGKIVGIIDHDNVLQKDTMFQEVSDIFKENPKSLGILGGLKHDLSESDVVRFVSIYGGDPFFAYRSVDFLRHFNSQDHGEYQTFKIERKNIKMTGGNCFFYLKKDVENIGGYSRDILVIRDLVNSGKSNLLIIKDATIHYAAKNLFDLIKKLFSGSAYYKKEETERFNYLPENSEQLSDFLRNLAFNLLVFPNLLVATKFYMKFKDPVAFTFLPIAFLDTFSKILNFLKKS